MTAPAPAPMPIFVASSPLVAVSQTRQGLGLQVVSCVPRSE